MSEDVKLETITKLEMPGVAVVMGWIVAPGQITIGPQTTDIIEKPPPSKLKMVMVIIIVACEEQLYL